jgi:acetoin utilization protein AcuC
MGDSSGPLLVFGPGSTTYDFGSDHPLTPRRFGPGIDLMRSVGAEPGLAPAPATDEDLLACHDAGYLAAVKRLSADPWGPSEAGIGMLSGDNPSFAGMHTAAALVAGGSLRAVEAILRGDVQHAHHPGGGLHHAMRDRASGFCIYDDPALAIARARREGRRVLYVDLDVHHGDGVEAIHADDPGVLTFSIHESGRYLFPGTGSVGDVGAGAAAGTIVNLPLEPSTGEGPWLAAVSTLLPALAAAFAPDLIVSQHGADSHAWDPLAHLRVTTTAMGEAARIVDAVAHRWAGGAWLATGGGGYDAYRVVPRAWALTWLAGAHRDFPAETPASWRERWASEAARYGQAPLPATFTDVPNAGLPLDGRQEAAEQAAHRTLRTVRRLALPRLLDEALVRGWWDPLAASRDAASRGSEGSGGGAGGGGGGVTLVPRLDRGSLDGLTVGRRVVSPPDPASARALLDAALASADRDGTIVSAAVDGSCIVGLAVSAAARPPGTGRELLALGIAPTVRRAGLATRLLETHLAALPDGGPLRALVTVAERDPVEPLDRLLRAGVARRLLERSGFEVHAAAGELGQADAMALEAVRSP